MDEILTTNPAERARKFIEEFSANSANTANGQRDRLVRHALAKMYELDVNDTSSLMIVISDAWKLPVQIRESLEQVGLDQEPFDHVLVELEKVLTMLMLDSSSQNVKNNIPANLSGSLRMISTMLKKDLNEVVLNRDQIASHLQSLDDLKVDLLEGKFDKEFTDFLLNRIESIEYALNHYETLGPSEVMDRVDMMFGGVIRKHSNLSSTKKKSSIVKKLLQVGVAIVFTINATNSVFELNDNITQFIESGIQQKSEPVIDGDTLIPKSDNKKIA